MNEHEVLKGILPYVPPYWVRQAFADPERTLVGREERIYAAVLYVDISGFTPISESLSRRGREGIEELSSILERYFAVMSVPALSLGGEVVKFAGDSLIALFPAQPDGADAHLGAALNSSLRMQKAMSDFVEVSTSAGTFPLRMKIGIGEGAIYNTTVGDEDLGIQYVFAGRPLARCQQAEGVAGAGEIVADAALVGRTPGRLDIGEARGTFRLIAGATDVPVLPPIEQVDTSGLSSERAAQLVRRLAPYLPAQLVERIRQGRPGVYGEHRRVTIMFVKFGGLNYDWEPTVGHVLQAHFVAMRDCILRYGGRLNEVDIGSDGGTLVVLFGAPTAHEDDELRAVSCAWEMQQIVAEVRVQAGAGARNLCQCIGISVGTVFVGGVGSATRRTYTAVGDEVNLAARLMNMAHWGEVITTRGLQKRAAGRFEFEAMGKVRVKGKTEPIPLYVLMAPRRRGTQTGLLSQLADRRFLAGRDEELALLSGVQDRAWRGIPQFALIVGEAGVGKSRLVGEVTQQWVGRGGHVYVGDCRCRGSDQFYCPWTMLLRTAFGLQESDSPERKREKVETELTFLSPVLARQLEPFVDLLHLGNLPSMVSASPTTPERERRFHRALRDFLRVSAQRRPLLLVLEDAHTIDNGSLSLLNGLLGDLRGLPILICAALRPRDDLALSRDGIAITRLHLNELSEADILSLARELLHDAGLSSGLASQVVAQTQGNPLYVQEMVNALAGFGDELDAAKALANGSLIPENVADAIQAQLDHLDEDTKLTLRIAAVVGPQFDFGVLRAAHPLPIAEDELTARLVSLEQRHVVYPTRSATDVAYRFHHPMTPKVIYASLLSADRERLHRWVGRALEDVCFQDLDSCCELVADHYYRGNVPSKAVPYLVMAGHHAAQAHTYREALALYERAQKVLSLCGPDRSPRCLKGVQLFLEFQQGDLCYRMAEVRAANEAYGRARELAGELADPRNQATAQLQLAGIAVRQARYQDALVLIRQAMQKSMVLDDGRALAQAWLLASQAHGLQGRFQEADRYLARAVSIHTKLQDDAGLARCKSWQGETWRLSGQLSRASSVLDRAADLGRRGGDQVVVAESLSRLALVLLSRGEWGRALDLSRQGWTMERERGNRLSMLDAQQVLAQTLTQVGAHVEAWNYLQEVLAASADNGCLVTFAAASWLSGETLLALGRGDQARDQFRQALELGRKSNTVEPTLRALLGLSKVAVLEGDWSEGQRLCTEVRAKARQGGMEPVIVEARLGLARAYLGRHDWAHAQREAAQALDASYRLHSPYQSLCATAILGEAMAKLGQHPRAEHYSQMARSIIQRLAASLPESDADVFLNSPSVSTVGECATGCPVSVL